MIEDWFIVNSRKKSILIYLITNYAFLKFTPTDSTNSTFSNSLASLEGSPVGSITFSISHGSSSHTNEQILVKITHTKGNPDQGFFRAIYEGLGGFIDECPTLKYLKVDND